MKRKNNPEDFYDYPAWEESWDGTYQTGSTRPPKSHKGVITVLLILVILLGGLVSALSVLNVRLFKQILQQPEQDDLPSVVFANSPTTAHAQEPESALSDALASANVSGDLEMDIQQSPHAVENVPQAGGLSLQEIYTKTIDSVVSISCVTGNSTSSGTGVVLTKDGYIVTNCHVVEGADLVEVLFSDERVLPANVVGTDAVTDLAVLRVDARNLSAAEFGDSSALRVGDSVVAIGDPLGVELRGTMTNGIVSAINRDITTRGRTMTLIQTNAALNSGNSGGPLINCYGQVIGINTMKIGDYMSSAGVEGLGFAIPSTTVKEIVDQLVTQGYVSGRPALGLSGTVVSAFYQMYYRLPEGMYITEVEPDSSAAAAGLRVGDILLQVNDTRIYDPEDLTALLYSCNVGDTLDVIIYRSGRQYSAAITVDEATG